jgi:hypothetical protein
MTLKVDAERWCECVISPGSLKNRPVRCGDVAISVCESCGAALCESHEILCIRCSSATCLNCEHACRGDAEELKLGAA